MLRSTLLWLSERKGLQGFILRSRIARRVARRFVAGETLAEAMEVTRRLNGRGMKVTLDHLGEAVADRRGAAQATSDYVRILERIEREKVDAGISIKLTQVGLAIDEDLCRANLRRVAEAARDCGNFVRIDMESSEYTQSTLRLFYDLFDTFNNVGVVVQSYMRRSEDDIRKLCSIGAAVRLCKGAYSEPESIAFQKKGGVDDNYLKLLSILGDCDSPLAVATHDDRMIEAGRRVARNGNRDRAFEFQMLYGIRRDLQARLVEQGYRMRVYLPYGTEWYPYFMRRMAERPANMFFVLRAMAGK